MGNKYVLGIDPGTTTGVAVLKYSDTEPPVADWLKAVEGGVHGFISWWRNNPWVQNRMTIIVSEKFIVEPMFTGDSESMKIEGALAALTDQRVFYQLRSQKEVLFPGLSEAKRFQRLRDLGFDGISGHELDAVTHAIVRLRMMQHVPTLEWLREESVNV